MLSQKSKRSALYLSASIFIHIALVAIFALAPSRPNTLTKTEPVPIVNSYLIIAKPKVQPPAPQRQQPESAEPKPEPEQIVKQDKVEPQAQDIDKPEPPRTSPITETKTEASVESQQPEQPVVTTQPSALPKESGELIAGKNDNSKPSFNPYASAQHYLNKLEQEQIQSLSKQSLSSFNSTSPLGKNNGRKTAEQFNRENSEAFAAKGSGVKVIANLNHNETLVSINGSCMKVSLNERGEQVWTGSNGCGNQDPFNGQLKKSLNKYLKKVRP